MHACKCIHVYRVRAIDIYYTKLITAIHSDAYTKEGEQYRTKAIQFNPFPPSVPIWHRVAKIYYK